MSLQSARAMNSPASIALVPYSDPWPAALERWKDIANVEYGEWLTDGAPNGKYDYATHARVTLTYDRNPAMPYFAGRIDAIGLKPNFCYQLKLLGKPVHGSRGIGAGTTYVDVDGTQHNVGNSAVNGDDWANEKIGYAGRWWDDNTQIAGTNLDDDYYLTYYRHPVANGAAEVRTIYGYQFMGSFITDGNGEAHHDFEGQYSYHIDWASWQGGTKDVLHGDFAVRGARNAEGAFYGYGIEAPETEVTLWYEYEPSRLGEVKLPPGTYHCRFLLTEESFHDGGLGGYWKSVLATEDFDDDGGADANPDNDVVFTIAVT